jgi:predicted DNA-binding transcriptional regulator AlpA
MTHEGAALSMGPWRHRVKRAHYCSVREPRLSTKDRREGFLRLRDIIGRSGLIPVSKSTWYKGIKDGLFPKGVKLTKRTTAWRARDVYDLVDRLGR